MDALIVGGSWLEKGEDGGGYFPWFCADVLGEKDG